MDAMHAILTRRSIRKYSSEPVSDEIITELLKAAMSAPTAGNQPWHYVVIRERNLLDSVSTFHPHAEMLKQAPVGIAVCGDPTVERLKGRWLLDCAAANRKHAHCSQCPRFGRGMGRHLSGGRAD